MDISCVSCDCMPQGMPALIVLYDDALDALAHAAGQVKATRNNASCVIDIPLLFFTPSTFFLRPRWLAATHRHRGLASVLWWLSAAAHAWLPAPCGRLHQCGRALERHQHVVHALDALPSASNRALPVQIGQPPCTDRTAQIGQLG